MISYEAPLILFYICESLLNYDIHYLSDVLCTHFLRSYKLFISPIWYSFSHLFHTFFILAEVVCPPLTKKPHVVFTEIGGNTYGALVVLECEKGYRLKDGVSHLNSYCNASGEWTIVPDNQTCQSK